MGSLFLDKGAVLFGLESSEGAGATLVAANAVSVMSVDPGNDVDVLNEREIGGGMGPGYLGVGGVRPSIPLTGKLRGSGVAATAPDYGPLLEVAAMVKSTRSAPIPSSGTTPCTGGSTTTATFDQSTGTGVQWSATNGSYKGETVELSGGPFAAPISVGILDYQKSGNIVTVTFPATLPAAVNSSTSIKLLPGVLYTTGNPAPAPSGELDWYTGPDQVTGNAVLHKYLGVRGGFGITATPLQVATWKATVAGLYGGKTDNAIPAGIVPPTLQAPAWGADPSSGGWCALDKTLLAVSGFDIDLGNTGDFSTDPNVGGGLEAYENRNRQAQGTIDPKMKSVATANWFGRLTNGDIMPVYIMVGKKVGGTVGNRHGLLVPNGQLFKHKPGNTNGRLREQLSFQASGFASEVFYHVF